MSDLDIERIAGETQAWCTECDRLNPRATRERVRLHARQTGHSTRFAVQQITAYRPSKRSTP